MNKLQKCEICNHGYFGNHICKFTEEKQQPVARNFNFNKYCGYIVNPTYAKPYYCERVKKKGTQWCHNHLKVLKIK